jgi:hypothetical protein
MAPQELQEKNSQDLVSSEVEDVVDRVLEDEEDVGEVGDNGEPRIGLHHPVVERWKNRTITVLFKLLKVKLVLALRETVVSE